MDWSFNEYYSSREAICADLTAILRKEIEGLVENGARVIQIDEPAISARPDEFSLAADCIKELIKGFRSYFILHHRHGDLTPVWSKLIRLPVDNIAFEITNPALSTLSLLRKESGDKDFTIGIIEAHNHEVESPQKISERIKETLKVIPANKLWFSSDAGLRTRTTEEAVQKMTVLSKTAHKFREKLV
jgi:5-methyltetrahydropteroyltriglutamate--homocysteine methyltransferase